MKPEVIDLGGDEIALVITKEQAAYLKCILGNGTVGMPTGTVYEVLRDYGDPTLSISFLGTAYNVKRTP